MLEKIKKEVSRLLLVLKLKKISISVKYIGIFFLLTKPKVVYLSPFLFSSLFLKFWKQNFMYFEHKHAFEKNNFRFNQIFFLSEAWQFLHGLYYTQYNTDCKPYLNIVRIINHLDCSQYNTYANPLNILFSEEE